MDIIDELHAGNLEPQCVAWVQCSKCDSEVQPIVEEDMPPTCPVCFAEIPDEAA